MLRLFGYLSVGALATLKSSSKFRRQEPVAELGLFFLWENFMHL